MTLAVPILLYHSIDDAFSAAYRRWAVTPARFDAQLRWLKSAGYTAVTISSLVAAYRGDTDMPERPVAITFDDGLRDFVTGAMPILDRHALPATLYVATDYIGGTSRWLAELGEGDRPMMSWDDVRAVARAGIELGAHTATHPEMDVLTPGEARKEIRTSKARIEDALDDAVRTFAYPHGYASRKTRSLVAEAGFESACRVRHALSSPTEDPFALSRVIMTEDILDDDMEALFADPPGLPVAPPVDRFLARPWRLARRVKRLMASPEVRAGQ